MASKPGPLNMGYAGVVRLGVRRSQHGIAISRRGAEGQPYSLFSAISVTDREEIVSSAREKPFLPGEAIFLEGDPVRQISLLTSGHVKMTQLTQSGLEVILRVVDQARSLGYFRIAGWLAIAPVHVQWSRRWCSSGKRMFSKMSC